MIMRRNPLKPCSERHANKEFLKFMLKQKPLDRWAQRWIQQLQKNLKVD